jgi:hypothetical protein
MRHEIEFEVPAFCVDRKECMKGLFKDATIYHIDGSPQSCQDTRSPEPDPAGQDGIAVMSERTYGIGNNLATWVTLLGALQKMERY